MTVLAQVRRLSTTELKSALCNDDKRRVLTIDCRPFLAYNSNHIRGSHNIHFPRILRRRCKGSLPLKHILTCPDTRDELLSGVFSLVVVYDENSEDLSAGRDGDMQPVLQTLLDEPISHLTTEVCFLEGGFQRFSRDFQSCCISTDQPVINSPNKLKIKRLPPFTLSLPPLSQNCCVNTEQPAMNSPNKLKPKRLPPMLTLSTPTRPLASNTLLNVASSPCPSPMQVCSPLSAGPNYERADPVQILEYLFLGSVCHASRKDILDAHGITAIVNVSTCCQNYFPSSFKYKHIPVNDDGDADLMGWFDEAAEFIDSVKLCGGKVLIHCYAGISRSATVCLAYLMKSRRMRLEEAFEFVRKVRAVISPNLGFMMQLSKYETELRQKERVPNISIQVPRSTRIAASQLSLGTSLEGITKKAKLSRDFSSIACSENSAAAIASRLTRSVSLPIGNCHANHKVPQGIGSSFRGRHDAPPQRFVFNFGMTPSPPSPFPNNWSMSPQLSPTPICSPS